jgi:predicted transcriptional regulator
MNGRRNDFEIIAEILKLAEKGAGQTRIMYGCNLNYGRLKSYLSSLEYKGLVECSRHYAHIEYRTTDRGRAALRHVETAVAALGETAPLIHNTPQ